MSYVIIRKTRGKGVGNGDDTMSNTILDIAKMAGVAKSTVSRYLNGGSVSEATKRKIEQVINETGYIPNTFAQSLKAKKPNIIGTIIPRLDSFATSQTLIGIDEHLKELNFQMLIANTSQDVTREIENIYSLKRQKVAGIILLAAQVTPAHLEAFQEVQLPVFLVGQQYEGVYSVIHNDEEAAYELGKHVLEMGHRKIAFLGVTETDIAVGVKRKEGFRRAIGEREDCEVRYYETSFKMEDAQVEAMRIMQEFRPSIIVCATDNIALGVMKAAYVNGLRIPTDLSITGFGGYDITEVIHPSLSTVKFYYKDAGRLAAQNIVKLIHGEQVPFVTISPHTFIQRESVDNKIGYLI